MDTRTPTASQKMKLVRLLAVYINTDGGHIGRQQRTYDAYARYFEGLETSFPGIAWRSDETQASLRAAATKLASAKVVRGPGATR